MTGQQTTTLHISTGEALLFGVIAVVMIALAVFGLLITRRAVYSAICVIADMVCLAFLYTMLEAPFMGVVQVAVYTGAILMMFLFVLMMIGVDAADSTHEILRGPRIFAVLGGLGFVVIGVGAVLAAREPEAAGLKQANADTNPGAIARAIVGNHVLAMELTGTLLIVAALGAMTLTHRERTRRKLDQAALQEAKMRAFAERGRHIGQKPPTGVYAESNSAADPALTVGGEIEEASVSRVLRIRGQARTLAEVSPITAARAARGDLTGIGVNSRVTNARLPGMPGEEAPDYTRSEGAGGRIDARAGADGRPEPPDPKAKTDGEAESRKPKEPERAGDAERAGTPGEPRASKGPEASERAEGSETSEEKSGESGRAEGAGHSGGKAPGSFGKAKKSGAS
ncbi:MAG: NADH-quinone oxidoreductase subunit J, partial [Peptidiphaga sp.]